MGERLQQSQAGRRRRILEACRALATRGGFEGVQMRQVAAEAGVALGTLYRYFPSKEYLLVAVLGEEIEKLRSSVADRPLAGASPLERTTKTLRKATDTVLKEKEVAGALLRALTSANADTARQIQTVRTSVSEMLAGAAGGQKPSEKHRNAAALLTHAWFGALIAWVDGTASTSQVRNELEAGAKLLLA